MLLVVRDVLFSTVRTHSALSQFYADHVPAWQPYEEEFQLHADTFRTMRRYYPLKIPTDVYNGFLCSIEEYLKSLSGRQKDIHLPGDFWHHVYALVKKKRKGMPELDDNVVLASKPPDAICTYRDIYDVAKVMFSNMSELYAHSVASETEIIDYGLVDIPPLFRKMATLHCRIISVACIRANLHSDEITPFLHLARSFYCSYVGKASIERIMRQAITAQGVAAKVLIVLSKAWLDHHNTHTVQLPYEMCVYQLDAIQGRFNPNAVAIRPIAFDPVTNEQVSGSLELDFLHSLAEREAYMRGNAASTLTTIATSQGTQKQQSKSKRAKQQAKIAQMDADEWYRNRLWLSDSDTKRIKHVVDVSEANDDAIGTQAKEWLDTSQVTVPDCSNFMFCSSCGRINTILTEFDGKGSSSVSRHESRHVSGYTDTFLDIFTGDMYCDRKQGKKASECKQTITTEMDIFGKLLFYHDRAYMTCPQLGCGIIMEYEPTKCVWTSRGPACALCSQQIFQSRLSQLLLTYKTPEETTATPLNGKPRGVSKSKKGEGPSMSTKAMKRAARAEAAKELNERMGMDLSKAKALSKKVTLHTRLGSRSKRKRKL
jgi:hypothetical protein